MNNFTPGLGHLPEFHFNFNAVGLFFFCLFKINFITTFKFSFSEGVEIPRQHKFFLARELHLILPLQMQRIYCLCFKKLPRFYSVVMLTGVLLRLHSNVWYNFKTSGPRNEGSNVYCKRLNFIVNSPGIFFVFFSSSNQ